MSKKYQHLLSPFKVGNILFKNRLVAAPSFPYLTQGPQNYPSDDVITHYANKAKSGAAIVTCNAAGMPQTPREVDLLKSREEYPNDFNPNHAWHHGSGRDDNYDLLTGSCQNILSMIYTGLNHHLLLERLINLRKLHEFQKLEIFLG